MRSSRVFVLFSLALLGLELLVILGSWMVAAAWPELPYRSLISFDGVRWLFGSFTDSMCSPLLIWLVTWAIACGTATESGLWRTLTTLRSRQKRSYRERMGLTAAALELLCAIALLAFLTLMPHALLRNALGHLYPSAFSASIVPATAFLTMVCSLTYGSATGSIATYDDAYRAMTAGVRRFSFVFPLYILLMQLLAAINFVL